jgi:hypothetical protein
MDEVMKHNTLVKSALLLLPLAIAFAASQWTGTETVVASCQQQRVITDSGLESLQLQCTHTPQQSWLGWAQGQSRSTQFHFIDLLELLNRLHSQQETK